MNKCIKISFFLFLILSSNLSFANRVNINTRSQLYTQFVEIKNEIGEDPKAFVPILFDVLMSVVPL
ncbi:hypothetical protein FACS189426_12490 [Bacteroidia bacterium]|nr:hypothetical protein FACS189426_12490 [Bacteroidia bacterium]